MKSDSESQLNMSYAGDDRFSKLLKSSSFFHMLEIHNTKNTAKEPQLKELLQCVANTAEIQAMLIDDRLLDDGDDGAFEMVQNAIVTTGKSVVPVISGKDAMNDRAVSKLNKYRTANVRDFLAVTGNLLKAHRDGKAAIAPNEYTDSIKILKIASESGDDNCTGVTVNPFKYTPEAQMAQYAKLMRKLNNGASFIVSEAGWDMKKYQELLWFLKCRNIMRPLVARIMLWNSESAIAQSTPGVPVPMKIASMDGDHDAILETTAMVAIGCRHLGYSGVVFAGIENAKTLNELTAKIHELESLYPNYSLWCNEWSRRFMESSLLPYSEVLAKQPPFYLYGALMNPDIIEYEPTEARPAMQNIKPPLLKDKIQAKVSSTNLPSWMKTTAGKITGSMPEDADYLAPCFGISNTECPKRLVLGPCGGSSVDGSCECETQQPCFFDRIIRLAVASNQIDFIEDATE